MAEPKVGGRRATARGRSRSDAGLDNAAIWSVFEAAPDGIIVADEAGRILLVNRRTEELFSYDRDALLGRDVEDLLPERFRQVHRAHRTRYRAEPRTRAMGTGLALFGRRADGSEFPVEISLSPLASDDGLRVVAAVRDVTERLRSEAETREIREALDATRDAVLIMDADSWGFRYVNQGAVDQSGYSRDELLTMTMLHITPEFTAVSLRELLAPLERGEQSSIVVTTTHRRRDGVDLPVEILIQAIPGDDGVPRGYVKIARDISDRLETEAQLRRTEHELETLADREQIARDLHDLVIQRLFAAGMSAQALTSQASDPGQVQRLQGIVDELDETIREIRSVIFGLQRQGAMGSGVRSAVLQVLRDEQAALGFEPHLRFDGVIDALPEPIATELLATLREALSNVARHAQATESRVTISAGDTLRLRVEDNGVGIDADAPSGGGLRNMRSRAERFGGSCRVVRGEAGSVVEWAVPLKSLDGR